MIKYRPCPWYNIHKEGAPIDYWGIQAKRPGSARYGHCVEGGKVIQFATKEEALKRIEELKSQEARA